MAFSDLSRIYIAVAIASTTLYFNSLSCGFVFDDIPAIKNNKDLDWNSPWSNLIWNDFWGAPMSKETSHKSYRPLTVFTFKLNNLLFGRDPWSYHAVNIVLHAFVCVLYFKLCIKICEICSRHGKNTNKKNRTRLETDNNQASQGKDFEVSLDSNLKTVAYIATALFVAHPIHCEAVTGVVGRAELLSAIFVLLSMLSYMKFTYSSLMFSAIFCICAVASKEQGITVVAICAVLDFFIAYRLTPLEFLLFRKTSNIYTGLRVAILCFIACIVMLWRFSVMGDSIPHFTNFDNPAALSSVPTRQFTYNFLLAQNTWLLINPGNLLCDWTMGTIPLISKFSDPRNIGTVAFWVIFLALSYIAATKKSPSAKVTLIALAFVVFSFLPASNLFFPVGFVVAERILYVPSMGYCLLVSVGISKFLKFPKLRTVTFCVFTVILLCFSTKTFLRNFDWKSDYTLFQSGLRITKSNAKIWNNVGHSLENDSLKTALQYFEEAAKVQPNDIGSHMNVGRIKKQLQYYTEAEESYRKAKDLLPQKIPGKRFTARIAPDHLQLFVHLGNLLKLNESRLSEADVLYKEAISMRNDFAEAYMNRGEILIMMGKLEEAIKCYKDALLHSDKKDDVYFNLGVVHSQIGNISGAVEYYTYAIQENANHIKALYNSAVIFEETGNDDLIRRAKIRVERVLKLEPENYLALSLLGSIHLDYGDEGAAVSYWKKVLEVHPDDKSALFNMALMYSKKKNSADKCLEVVETLLNFHPKYIKGLMLYGEVLLNQKKDTKGATEAFRRVVETDPSDIKARHNLCVVIMEEGRLEDAEKCMHNVLIMAPDAKYVADNLAIIKKHVARQAKSKIERDIGFIKDDEKKQENQKSQPSKTTKNVPIADQEDEDLVFVEPVRKKTYTEKAKSILASAKNAADLASKSGDQDKLKNIENALKTVHAAVDKLTALNEEVSIDHAKKCSQETKIEINSESEETEEQEKPSKETENLRQKALNFLDELEASLS